MSFDLCIIQPGVYRPPSTSIHDLDNDSLLNIFSLFRPISFEKDEYGNIRWNLVHERWWYKFAHVCQRWRCLILGSASHLGLCLVCAPCTPVSDMLAHSPPLPLIIDHNHPNHELSPEDEEGIILRCVCSTFVTYPTNSSTSRCNVLPVIPTNFH